MQPGESYPPKSWPITCFEDARDLREPPPDEDDVLVSVESENNSNEVCTFRAVVMHQHCANFTMVKWSSPFFVLLTRAVAAYRCSRAP